MKVTTDSPLFYHYLIGREIEFRQREHSLELSDVTALGSHFGEFEITDEELDALVRRTIRVKSYMGYGAHHKVWIGRWVLGISWDNKLMEATRVEVQP